MSLGSYLTEEEAAKAYDAAVRVTTHTIHVNFPANEPYALTGPTGIRTQFIEVKSIKKSEGGRYTGITYSGCHAGGKGRMFQASNTVKINRFATEKEGARYFDDGARIRKRQLRVNFPILRDGNLATSAPSPSPSPNSCAQLATSSSTYVERQAEKQCLDNPTSSYCGVFQSAGVKHRKWCARHRSHIGSFATERDAAEAHDATARMFVQSCPLEVNFPVGPDEIKGRPRSRKHPTSEYMGVHHPKYGGEGDRSATPFHAMHGMKYLGSFPTELAAAKAVDKFVRKCPREVFVNFPRPGFHPVTVEPATTRPLPQSPTHLGDAFDEAQVASSITQWTVNLSEAATARRKARVAAGGPDEASPEPDHGAASSADPEPKRTDRKTKVTPTTRKRPRGSLAPMFEVGDQVRIVANNNHNDIMRHRYPNLGGQIATVTSTPCIPQKWMTVAVEGIAETIRLRSTNCELLKGDGPQPKQSQRASVADAPVTSTPPPSTPRPSTPGGFDATSASASDRASASASPSPNKDPKDADSSSSNTNRPQPSSPERAVYEVQATARTPGASTKAGVVKYEHGSLVLWRAALNGVVLGFHRNEEDAAEAYDAAVRADAKEAPLSVNFPDPDRKEATNLRLAQKRMSGASKYAGVTKYKGQSSSAPTRWGASHPIMGALGRFATEEEAARAWDNAERGCGRIVAVNSPRSGAGALAWTSRCRRCRRASLCACCRGPHVRGPLFAVFSQCSPW